MGIRLQLRVISRAAASFVPEIQTMANKYLKALCSAMGKPQTLQRFGLGNRSPEGRQEKPMCTGAPRAALGLGAGWGWSPRSAPRLWPVGWYLAQVGQ